MYALDETDSECHGMREAVGPYHIDDDPAWEDTYVDRMVRMIERDENHPSVVIWSLGNESGFGNNHRTTANATRKHDPHPIHYEPDTEQEVSDPTVSLDRTVVDRPR